MDRVIAERGALNVFETTQHPSAMAFSQGGQRVVTGVEDGAVRVWDVAASQAVGQPMTGRTGAVLSVALSPDGKRIATGSNDHTVRMWDAATGQPIGAPMTSHTDKVTQRGVQPRRTSASSPAVGTAPCGCGTPTPASRSGRR